MSVVKMETADYYKLRTRIADAEAAKARANEIIAVKEALVKELAAKYNFDPACKQWQANDETEEFNFIGAGS